MNEIDMMQAILNELQGISSRLDRLENGQKALEDGQKAMTSRMDSSEVSQKAMSSRMDSIEESQRVLEDGQKMIRRDIARVDRKIDHLSDDMSDALTLITENVDAELNKLKQAQ